MPVHSIRSPSALFFLRHCRSCRSSLPPDGRQDHAFPGQFSRAADAGCRWHAICPYRWSRADCDAAARFRRHGRHVGAVGRGACQGPHGDRSRSAPCCCCFLRFPPTFRSCSSGSCRSSRAPSVTLSAKRSRHFLWRRRSFCHGDCFSNGGGRACSAPGRRGRCRKCRSEHRVGSVEQLFERPEHPLTRVLIVAVSRVDHAEGSLAG
jgi:hypothetical protein